jgi:hypothetical protein
MRLKNWAFFLFNPEGTLFHQGFSNVRPTPTVSTPDGLLTPDLMAWDNSTVLVIECCSGTPNANDSTKVEKYSRLPSGSYRTLTGIGSPLVESVLLYYEDRFKPTEQATEGLLRAISMRRDIAVWTCIPSIAIQIAAGSHANSTLESVMRGGAPLGPYPSPSIEIQPDSPTELVARVLFRRLFEFAMRSRDTSFTLTQAQESIADQNYATQAGEEETRVRRAIEIGVRFGLCGVEHPGVRWRLDFYRDRHVTVERFLARLSGILSQRSLMDFGGQV